MTDIERRSWTPEDVEMRAEGDGMTFTGYAIRYGVPSQPLPFTEFIAEGAATRTLSSRNNIKAFVNHDTNMVIGSTRAGTLKLTEDSRGVLAEIQLPDTTYGRDLAISVKRGDVSGMSFGFSAVEDNWNEDYSQRTVTELRLHEVSPVTGFEAYTQTDAAVRSINTYKMLAHRCCEDAAMLEIAVEALLMAEKLDAPSADLLRSVIDKMSMEDAPEMPTAEITIEDIPVDVLLQQLSLLEKQIAP